MSASQSERDKAQEGLRLLKEAILEVLRARPDGVTNAEICDVLDIRSDYAGGQKDYLSWSVLGLLLKRGARTTNWSAARNEVFCNLTIVLTTEPRLQPNVRNVSVPFATRIDPQHRSMGDNTPSSTSI